MRIALHSEITPGHIDEYRARHARIPDELRELFDEAGIADWTIWRSGHRLFHLVECDDFDAAMAVVNASAANDRWQADIGRFVAVFHDRDGQEGFAPLDEVWSLQAQREAAEA